MFLQCQKAKQTKKLCGLISVYDAARRAGVFVVVLNSSGHFLIGPGGLLKWRERDCTNWP